MPTAAKPRTLHIAVLGFPDAQILDITGPLEVFGRTSRWLRDHRGLAHDAYAVEVIGLARGAFATSSGLKLVAERAFPAVRAGLDTLLVAGGTGTERAARNRRLQAWLRRVQPRVRRFGSVCSGAFILAAAGLLDGRRVATHWRVCGILQKLFPAVEVDGDAIFVKDGRLYTSAGVTAGMDLALALVEEDHGHDVALEVARELVMFVRRPGGQSQFSAQLRAQLAAARPIRDLQAFIADHVDADLSVEACAARTAMSPRNFARRFHHEVGQTPAAYVEASRVEAARRRLEESAEGVEAVAHRCGFGTAETMRRAFLRRIHVSPNDYRGRFRGKEQEKR
jgi:transcriptional regulator GlxA family with amidase domain